MDAFAGDAGRALGGGVVGRVLEGEVEGGAGPFGAGVDGEGAVAAGGAELVAAVPVEDASCVGQDGRCGG